MPSKQRRRRKKRPLEVNWPVVLWGSAIINVGWGLFTSPITSPVKVRVVNSDKIDEPVLHEILQDLRGRPAGLVNKKSVESQVLSTGRFEFATLRLNLFGRGVLQLAPRKAVGVLEGSSLAIDRWGVLFPDPHPSPNLPKLAAPAEASQPQVAFQGPWESRDAAKLCILLMEKAKDMPWTVQLDARGSTQIKSDKRATVIVGNTANLDEKIDVLADILRQKPEILNQVSELNISAPKNPTYKS